MTPTEQNEVSRRRVSVASQTEFGQSAKRKGISPLNEKKANFSKKPSRMDEMTYAEILRDGESEWMRVEGRRRVRSRIESSMGTEGLNGRTPVRVARERTPRRRSEVILVKVGQGSNWIDSYREVAEIRAPLRRRQQ